MEGPGKYDDIATVARETAEAQGVILVVIGGNKGNGMSCQFTTARLKTTIPLVLRDMADMIEEEEKGRKCR